MRSNGFVFSRRNGNAWQRGRNEISNQRAKALAEEYNSTEQ